MYQKSPLVINAASNQSTQRESTQILSGMCEQLGRPNFERRYPRVLGRQWKIRKIHELPANEPVRDGFVGW